MSVGAGVAVGAGVTVGAGMAVSAQVAVSAGVAAKLRYATVRSRKVVNCWCRRDKLAVAGVS